MDCQCFGILKHKDGKVYLFTEEILSTRSIHTQKYDLQKKTFKKKVTEKLSLAEHGFATDAQQYSYLGLGSLLWISIMLIGKPFFFLSKNNLV